MAVYSQRKNSVRDLALHDRCALCETSQGKLSRCGGCRLVKYSSKEHQVQHRKQHKAACKKITKFRTKLQEEDYLVRNATADFMTPANAFETHVGHFWGLVHTRDYMRARWALAYHAIEMNTLDGVQEGLGHYRDMLRLCRGDNMGVRDKVPALMLRVNQDQQAYDFIKWWSTVPDRYDWGDMSLPYLDTSGADAFETPTYLLGKYKSLVHQVEVLLLKVKILIDIRQILVTRKVLKDHLPAELTRIVAEMEVRSPLSSRLSGKTNLELVRIEKRLTSHCCRLGAAITESNEHMVFELLEADEETLSYQPEAYSAGSYEEASLALQTTYVAWQETPGALELLKEARACAARDSEDEVEDFLDDDNDGRTAEEFLSDVSLRIWAYLSYGVANGSYLGPPAERPSERWTREAKAAWDKAVAEEEDLAAYSSDDSD